MSRVTLTKTTMNGNYPASGVLATFTAADASNHNQFPLTGEELIVARNDGSVTRNVTLTSVADSHNRAGTISAQNIPAHVARTITAVANLISDGDVLVTSNSHGLAEGDFVWITGIVGAAQVNSGFYVRNPAANTFNISVTPTGSLLQGNDDAYTSDGTATPSNYKIFGPFTRKEGWQQSDGEFYLQASHADVKFAVLRLSNQV